MNIPVQKELVVFGAVARFIQEDIVRRLRLAKQLPNEITSFAKLPEGTLLWEFLSDEFSVTDEDAASELQSWGQFWWTDEYFHILDREAWPTRHPYPFVHALRWTESPLAEESWFNGCYLPLNFRGPLLVSGEKNGVWMIPEVELNPLDDLGRFARYRQERESRER